MKGNLLKLTEQIKKKKKNTEKETLKYCRSTLYVKEKSEQIFPGSVFKSKTEHAVSQSESSANSDI